MNKTVLFSIRRVLNWLTAAAVVLVGVCFIGGCLHIYTVHGTYSREIVAAVFSHIAVPAYIALALITIGLVWEFIAPSPQSRMKPPKAYTAMLDRLHTTRVQDENTKNATATEKAKRRLYREICAACVYIGAACFLQYAVNPAHYTADINASMIRAMWFAIPGFAVPFVVSLVISHLINKSYQREIDLLKTLPRTEQSTVANPPVAQAESRTPAIVRAVLIVLAVAALIYGFATGGTVDVLTKAINICTECIGLG